MVSRLRDTSIILVIGACWAIPGCDHYSPERPANVPATADFHRSGNKPLAGSTLKWIDCEDTESDLNCTIWSDEGELLQSGKFEMHENDDWCPSLVERTTLKYEHGFLLPVDVRSYQDSTVLGSAKGKEEIEAAVTELAMRHYQIEVTGISITRYNMSFDKIVAENDADRDPLIGFVQCDLVFSLNPPQK